jgi:hypothetical protein
VLLCFNFCFWKCHGRSCHLDIVVSFSANYNILFFNLSLVETNAYNFHMTKNSHGLTSESLFSPRKKRRNPTADAAVRPLGRRGEEGQEERCCQHRLRFLLGGWPDRESFPPTHGLTLVFILQSAPISIDQNLEHLRFLVSGFPTLEFSTPSLTAC